MLIRIFDYLADMARHGWAGRVALRICRLHSQIRSLVEWPEIKRVRANCLKIRTVISPIYSPEDIFDRQSNMALLSRKMALL